MAAPKKTRREKLPPNFGPFIDALRQIGYSFEEAVADIVDNSIDAAASNVRIRFVIRESHGVDLAIADDGSGMSAKILREAMRFGTVLPRENEKRLGMFGLGLKLASMAHADSVFVLSRSNGSLSGRAWTDEGLKEGFACDLLDKEDMIQIMELAGKLWSGRQGTLVYWDTLFRYSKNFDEPYILCDRLIKDLRDYLGLHLHRLLDNMAITIDILDLDSGEVGPGRHVDILDPFGYSNTGSKGYPKEMVPPESFGDKLEITSHIWPSKSTTKNYKLPGGANKRQGLYFYRNNRLLSAGSWHGIRDEDPHMSLARAEIDLKVDVKRASGVNVKKARISLTPEMRSAIENSKAKDGTIFRKYMSRAQKLYRKQEKKNPRSFPLVPDGGYPRALTRLLSELLDKNRTGSARKFDFEWYEFEEGEDAFFGIDRTEREIWLNRAYRELFRSGERLSRNDGILVKTLLFILLRGYLDTERMSAKKQEYLNLLDKILAEAAKAELRRRGF